MNQKQTQEPKPYTPAEFAPKTKAEQRWAAYDLNRSDVWLAMDVSFAEYQDQKGTQHGRRR